MLATCIRVHFPWRLAKKVLILLDKVDMPHASNLFDTVLTHLRSIFRFHGWRSSIQFHDFASHLNHSHVGCRAISLVSSWLDRYGGLWSDLEILATQITPSYSCRRSPLAFAWEFSAQISTIQSRWCESFFFPLFSIDPGRIGIAKV